MSLLQDFRSLFGCLSSGDRLLLGATLSVLVLFGLAAYSESMLLPAVDDSDEPGYLGEACWIAEHGGITGLPRESFSGRLPFEYRHPLIQALVSPWAIRSLEAVRPMRAAKFVVSLLCAAAFFAVAWRALGLPSGAALTALLVVSKNWYMKSRVVCVEPLIYLIFFFSWALIVGAFRPRGRWLWAGMAVAAAWLAKGTALLLLLAFPLALLWTTLSRRSRPQAGVPEAVESVGEWKRLAGAVGLFAAGFIIVGSPLLVRNAVRYRNPLYNKNSELLWADEYGAHLMTEAQRTALPMTARSYFSRHSIGDAAQRLAIGMTKQLPRLLGSLAPDVSFGRLPWIGLLAISGVLVLVGLWAILAQRGSWAGAYSACLLALAFLLFSWHHPITYSSRFIATLGPICGFAAFGIINKVAQARSGIYLWQRRAALGLTVVCAVMLACRIQPRGLVQPAGRVPESPEYRFLVDWFERNVARSGAVCFRTPYLAPRYAFGWLFETRAMIYDIPPFARFAELQEHMESLGAKYLIVERDSLRDRIALLGPYFGHDPKGQLLIKSIPPGWRLATEDPFAPLDFAILERVSEASKSSGALRTADN